MHFQEAIVDAEIRAGVFRARPTSLDDAVTAAVETENYLTLEKSRKVGSQRHQVRATQAAPESTSTNTALEGIMSSLTEVLGDIKKKLDASEEQQQRWRRNQRKDISKMKCHNCGIMGHMYRNCPEPLRDHIRNRPGNETPPTNK
jgi:hypothetical protein